MADTKRYDTTPYTYRVRVFYGVTELQAYKTCKASEFTPAIIDTASDGAIVCFESESDWERWDSLVN